VQEAFDVYVTGSDFWDYAVVDAEYRFAGFSSPEGEDWASRGPELEIEIPSKIQVAARKPPVRARPRGRIAVSLIVAG